MIEGVFHEPCLALEPARAAGRSSPRGAERERFSLPWLTLTVAAGDSRLAAEVRRALARLSTFPGGAGGAFLDADLSLDEGSGSRTAATTWERGNVRYQFVRGEVDDAGARFATAEGSLLSLDATARRLTGRVRSATFSAPYSTWPDLVLAPLTACWRAHGCYPLHAAAVEFAGQRLLLPGPSGSGKTTLSLALVRGGGAWRADDKLLFTRRAGATRAISLYRNANVHPDTAARFAELRFVLDRPPLDRTNAKRACQMEEVAPRVDLREFTPSILVFPEVVPAARSRVVPLARPAAHLMLASQSPTCSHRPRLRAQVEALAGLARELPAYRLLAGQDVLEAPASVASLLRAALDGEAR